MRRVRSTLVFPMAFGLRPMALLVTFGLWPMAFVQPPKVDTSAKAVIARAAAYVAQYQKDFAFLLATEHYQQSRSLPPTPAPSTNSRIVISGDGRSTDAEVLLTYVDSSDAWIF